MSEQRYVELNGRLAEPPEFDVFDSEQLGLFVVGQLAKRHGIRVTLRPSPYGGTTAIALIPTTLVGVEEGFMEGLPTGMTVSSAWAARETRCPATRRCSHPPRARSSPASRGARCRRATARSARRTGTRRWPGTRVRPGPSRRPRRPASAPTPTSPHAAFQTAAFQTAARRIAAPAALRPTAPACRTANSRTAPIHTPARRTAGRPRRAARPRAARGHQPRPDGNRPAVAVRPPGAQRQRQGPAAHGPGPGERPGPSARGHLPALLTGRNGLPAAGGSLPGPAGAAAPGAGRGPRRRSLLLRGRARHAAGRRPLPQRRDGPPGRRFVPQRERGPGAAGRDVQGAAEAGPPGQPGSAAPRSRHAEQHAVGGVRGQRRQPLARRHPQRAVGDAAWLAAGTRGRTRAARRNKTAHTPTGPMRPVGAMGRPGRRNGARRRTAREQRGAGDRPGPQK